MHSVEQILKNALAITAFVLSMMLLIEYINVKTKGAFSNKLQNKKSRQIFLAAIFGAIPGCLGTYTVVSLYTHKLAGIGALVAVMVATSGDEAFYLFSLSPKTGFILTVLLFIIAIVFGFLSEWLFGKKSITPNLNGHLAIHDNEVDYKCAFDLKSIIHQLKHISFHRALLLVSVILFIFFIIFNGTGHSHEFLGVDQIHSEHENEHEFDWISLSFILISLFTLFVVSTVSDHFLEDHLWSHILKKHFLKVFLWTLVALIVIKFIDHFIDFSIFVNEHKYLILIFALLIGLIPESGPHMLFVTMFISGSLPFSILLANSIVQDGHGALPLFAESKSSFVFVKLINLAIGSIFGFLGLLLGF